MPSLGRTIRETLLTVTSRAGDTFALVTFDDGSYGLTNSGKPIGGYHWPDDQLIECVEALVRLAALNSDGD